MHGDRGSALGGRLRRADQAVCRRRTVPEPSRDGAARIRSRRIQVLRVPASSLVSVLRATLYPPLAAIANRWNDALGIDTRYPADHAAFLERCAAAGQGKPTPLLLQY